MQDWLWHGTEDFDPLVCYGFGGVRPAIQRYIHSQLPGMKFDEARALGLQWGIDVCYGNSGVMCYFDSHRVVVFVDSVGRIYRVNRFG